MRTIAPASAVQTVSLANDDDGLMRLEEKCNGCTHTCGPPSSNPRRRGSLATSAGGVGWLEAPPPLPALLARRVSYCNTCSAAKSASRRVARLARRSTHRSDGGPHELTTRGVRQQKHGADEVWGGFGTRPLVLLCKVLCGSATAAPPSRPPPSILYSVGRAGAWGLAHEQEQDAL